MENECKMSRCFIFFSSNKRIEMKSVTALEGYSRVNYRDHDPLRPSETVSKACLISTGCFCREMSYNSGAFIYFCIFGGNGQ